MNEGLFMIVTSGGLHHIQRPGQLIPKLFNTIKIVTEIHDIFDLKCKLLSQLANTTKSGDLSYKMSLIQFLEERKKQHLELMGVY
jgi:NAD-dependent DNA ligase